MGDKERAELARVEKKEEKEDTKPNPFVGHFLLQTIDLTHETPTNSHTSTHLHQTRLTKPRDIPILELKHLGLDAAARLQMFFELAERCTPFDNTRIQVAKERVSSELAVNNTHYTLGIISKPSSALSLRWSLAGTG